MDNLSLHRSFDVRSRMDELGFSYTYTPIYSPQYNGIEEVIGIGKKLVKSQRLENILRGANPNLRELIQEAFEGICPHQAAKCMARSLQLLDLE